MNELIPVLDYQDISKRNQWRWICLKLAKANLRAMRDYHNKVLNHDAYMRKGRVRCKTCGEEYLITPIDIHCQITGQPMSEAKGWFEKLENDRKAAYRNTSVD